MSFRILKNKKMVLGLLSVLFCAVYSAAFLCFSLLIIKDSSLYKLDQFVGELSNTMEYGDDKTKRTILNVKYDHNSEEKSYPFRGLMSASNGYYSFGDARTIIENKFTWNDIDIHLDTQSNFYTTNAVDDYGYKYIQIDYGTYSTYFLDEELINRNAGNHQSFILISDTFAKKLLNYYGTWDESKSEKDQFKDLVFDEEKGTLKLHSSRIDLDLRIVNIIRTDYLNGIRTQQIYGDFGVFYISTKIDMKKFDISFEVDLKKNESCIKNSFDFLKRNDAEPSKYAYRYKVFTDDGYKIDENLNTKYYKMLRSNPIKDNFVIIFSIYFIALNTGYLVLLYFLSEKITRLGFYAFLGSSIVLIVFGLIACFAYVYPFLSIIPVVLCLESFLFGFEEIKDVIRKFVKKNQK